MMSLLVSAPLTFAQSPSPTPADKRGIGIQSSGTTTQSQPSQQAKEAKPELVLQTGYNELFGASRLVFSPDGRLLATATYRSSTVKLWETATNRKLRDLSLGGQSSPTFAPIVAFSRDNKYLASAAGDNSVKVWEVANGREVQTLAGTQGTVTSAMGVGFIGFMTNTQLVSVSDAIRVWDINTGALVRTIEGNTLSSFNIGDSAITLSLDGSQLVMIGDSGQLRFIDLNSGKDVRKADLPVR
jgi:WD40 repeat protein